MQSFINKRSILTILQSILGVTLFAVAVYMANINGKPIMEQLMDSFLESTQYSRSIKPAVPTEELILPGDVQSLLRANSFMAKRNAAVVTDTVSYFDDARVRHNTGIGLSQASSTPQIIEYSSLSEIAPPDPVAKLSIPPGGSQIPITGKGTSGMHIRIARAHMRVDTLSIATTIVASDPGPANVAKEVRLGGVEVPPLPRGEPGGRVIGRGKNIRGVLRFTRIHHDLADWWADQSSMIALIEWLNTQTQIKADMNVEGGAIRLTDPKLSKSPLVFFTGHDPALVRERELSNGIALRNRLAEPEKDALRRYLIEDGGFIFFDDCGVNAPSQAFLRLILAQLRYAMPEYSVDRIPNDHEIYNNYYEMGGPPVGFDIFWWGTHPPKYNYLEGITIGDHLGALLCKRDYMCAMETVSLPTKAVHYSPGVYRFTTNVVVYALTHGGISDYSRYSPRFMVSDEISIEAPVIVPELE